MTILIFKAESGRQKLPVLAKVRPYTLSSSTYNELHGNPATLSLFKQLDLEWLTIISQSWHKTAFTELQTAEAKDPALAVRDPSPLALSNWFTPFLKKLSYSLDVIQVSWRQRTKWYKLNEKQHSRIVTVGRGLVSDCLGVPAALVKFPSMSQLPQLEFWGSSASTTEVRPC